MMEKRRYCIVCCDDLEKQKKGRIHYPYKYNLLGLVQVFCKYLECDFESLFGTSEVDFGRDQFPFCLECKMLMVKMFGLEESIKVILSNIQELVRKLSARCLSCKKKNCTSCKGRKRKKVPVKPRTGTLNPETDMSGDPEHLETEGKLLLNPITETHEKEEHMVVELKPHLRSILEPKLCPRVIVTKEEPQSLARSAGLTIFEPPPVAPNVFKSLQTVFEEDAHRAAQVPHPDPHEISYQQYDYLANPGSENETGVYLYETIEVTMTEGDELVQTVCLDVVEEVVNAEHIDLSKYLVNGVPVFEMRDGLLKCAMCGTDREVFLTELYEHYKFHGGLDEPLVASAAAIQGIPTGHIVAMANPAIPIEPLHVTGTMELSSEHPHHPDQMVLRAITDASQTMSLGMENMDCAQPDDSLVQEQGHENNPEIMEMTAGEESQEDQGNETLVQSDHSAEETEADNVESLDKETSRQRSKKLANDAILAKESTEAFAELFKFLEVEDMERNLIRLNVMSVEDNLMLLENQWTFEFHEGKGYKCGSCDFESTTPEDFVNHSRVEHPTFTWTKTRLHTRLCKQIVMLRKRIQKTLENATDESWRDFYSDIYKKATVSTALFDLKTRPIDHNVFVFDNSLKFHIADTHFYCDMCGFKEKWKSIFIHHLYEAHASDDTPGKDLQVDAAAMEEVSPDKYAYRGFTAEKIQDKYCCGACKYSTTDLNIIRRHLYSAHYAKTRLTCDKCEAVFPTKLKLAIHKKSHENEDPQAIGKVYRKERMVEIEPDRFLYREFYVTKIGDLFRCDTCNATTPTKAKMQTHLYGSHFTKGRPKKEKICETCGKVFYNARNFYTHKLNHTSRINPGQFVCENCGRVFRSRECLRRHKRKYRDKNVECKICGKKFLWQSKLESHMVRHSDAKKYECVECNKFYKNPESLLQHKRTHGGNKPYFCDICHMRFTQSYSVVKHKMAIHHEAKTPATIAPS